MIADQDRFSVDEVRGVEISATVAECADLGRIESADAAVGPIKAPLMGSRIVESEGKAFDLAGGAIEFESVELGAAVPDFVAGESPAELVPGSVAGEGFKEAPEVKREVPEERVEIMRAIMERRLNSRWRRGDCAKTGAARRQIETKKDEFRKLAVSWMNSLVMISSVAEQKVSFTLTLTHPMVALKRPPSMELAIPLSRGGEPLFRQTYRGIRHAILSGTIGAGDRLPSTRDLAEWLGISRTVVLLAYEQLMAEGFIAGRAGSGTYVTAGLALNIAGKTKADAAAVVTVGQCHQRIDLGGGDATPAPGGASVQLHLRT